MAATIAQEDIPVSRTHTYRKVMKPMLERKRRARINRCLDELKELLVGALQAEGESVSRLEKADVLELTVRHLHKLRRSQQLSESSAGERFRQGFVHCANEVSKYISSAVSSTSSSVDLSVSGRLMSHLDQCVRSFEGSPSHMHHPQLLHPPQAMPPPMPQGSPRASQLSPGYALPPPQAMMSPVGPQQIVGREGLNILTSYTPPSSPMSASSSPSSSSGGSGGHHHQKIYYVPTSASVGGSSASSTGSMSPIPPAHYNSVNLYAAHGIGNPPPLSLCTKYPNPDEPFDLSSNSVWRPW